MDKSVFRVFAVFFSIEIPFHVVNVTSISLAPERLFDGYLCNRTIVLCGIHSSFFTLVFCTKLIIISSISINHALIYLGVLSLSLLSFHPCVTSKSISTNINNDHSSFNLLNFPTLCVLNCDFVFSRLYLLL